MANKKKAFLRTSIIVSSTLCLLVTGCSNNQSIDNKSQDKEPVSSQEIISSKEEEEQYHIVRPDFTPDYNHFGVSSAPSGVNMTYYSDIYSRGFSWLTDENTKDTELYLTLSDKGKDADFDNAEIKALGNSVKLSYDTSGNVTGENESGEVVIPKAKGSSNASAVTIMSHKVHVENLQKGKAYSYKIGSSSGGYTYGAFIVEKEKSKGITAVHMSDAQTKDLNKSNVWRNTFVKSVITAGDDLDFALYNGDQFDQNNATGNDKEPFRLYRYSNAIDIIQDYKFNIPYMSSSGNHEPSSPYSHYIMGEINYGGYDVKGGYYSYDYEYAHFVVLNTNTVDDAQVNWLKEDLKAAKDAKWKVVMMHISPYSSGDHSNKSENQNIVKTFTPIFSENHVDLVLQAHDHTYNKTLPYRWDSVGYTETYHNDEVVNLNPAKSKVDGVEYDVDPEGTYYVTTGAAGHRYGASETDGIYAEYVLDNGEIKGLNPSKTFVNNKYKLELGELTQETQYEPYTFGSYTSDQHYEIGDPASGNVNAPMFGVLNITEETLSYHVYTAIGDDVKLFDTLDVLKE